MSQNTRQSTRLRINGPAETYRSHPHSSLEKIAHVYHLEWHGIRSATSCLPGKKIGISADDSIDGDAIRRVIGFVYEEQVEHIIYQGFSSNANILCRALRSVFKNKIKQYAITHVTSTQLEYTFEIDQQKSILSCLEEGVLDRIGSVKPYFSKVIPQYWDEVIYNAPPRLDTYFISKNKQLDSVFIPLENTLRKNLYSNVIGAINSNKADQVFLVNNPTGLDLLIDTRKIKVIGYQRGNQLYDRMAEAAIVLNCTLAECQPMTQLESLAVGTPCLTGKLGLPDLINHPITELTEVNILDGVHEITNSIDRLFYEMSHRPKEFKEKLTDYLSKRIELSLRSLEKFVDTTN